MTYTTDHTLKIIGGTTHKNPPLVSWLIPTTLHNHRWWKRLSEFLQEDFPSEQIECIFLNTQDKGFAEEAYKIGEEVMSSLTFIKGVREKWERVKFVEVHVDQFNISVSRNLLAQLAEGSVLIYRDADCQLLQYGFTKYIVKTLLDNKLGIIGVPSLKDGLHFKPRSTLPSRFLENYLNLSVTATVNGMSTAILKNILLDAGGWNEGLLNWGEHTALCAKLTRMGFVVGYAVDRGYWLAAGSGESNFSLTDNQTYSPAMQARALGYTLLKDFYNVSTKDTFSQVEKDTYNLSARHYKTISNQVEKQRTIFNAFQSHNKEKELFNFKPLACLTSKETMRYIAGGYQIALPYFEEVMKHFHNKRVYEQLHINNHGIFLNI